MSKPKWARITKQAITKQFNSEFLHQASVSTKMVDIMHVKSKPSLEPYMTALSRRQACVIFRIRSKMTKAADNMTGSTTFPICSKCEDNLESDHHLFTNCRATEPLRTKYTITGIEPIFNVDTPMSTLANYAEFAIEIGMSTYTTHKDQQQ